MAQVDKKMSNNKRRPEKKWYVLFIFILFIVLLGAGYAALKNWQSKPETLQASSITINQLPSTDTKKNINRPTLEQGEPDKITIPDRGIDAPIIYINEKTEDVFQDALTNGVVHYPGTALPGEYGNPYIFGHSSDYFWKPGDYKKIFEPLVDIPIDTEVKITNREGELFIYRVIETKIVGPKDISVLDQNNNERQLLTLQTSWPVGTALKRFIAVSEIDEEATYGMPAAE